jgi:nucleoside-diphosphate-sugar epimerase
MSRVVVVTGAGGNIGRKVATHFSGLGWQVRGLDIRGEDVTTADLTADAATWAQHFVGADAVVHLAGDPSPLASWESAQRLNIDMTLAVTRVAIAQRLRRMVFASSNWTMVGYRFGTEVLTTDLPPHPLNPYGVSKLMGERIGWDAAARGLSFIALRIGWCQRTPGNLPGPQMETGTWGQAMWLSDRDLSHGMERAVLADGINVAVLNLMSDNRGMRWDIETTRRVIGYSPRDSHTPILTPEIAHGEALAQNSRALAADLEAQIMRAGW